MAPKREVRLDVGNLRGRGARTPQGFLKVPGNLTRIGVLTYTRADGSLFRELRHPDDVFRRDSLASLALAPITDRHPAELVNTRNVRDLQVGIVTGVHRDSRFVQGDLIVQDQRMIDKIDAGERRELSAGYTCHVDQDPGSFNGERYDGRQRDITYNHVAIGPRDWGRAGSEVALHLDGFADDLIALTGVEVRNDDNRARVPEITTGDKKMDMITIRIDGLDFEVPKAAAPAILKALSDRDTKITDLSKRTDEQDGKVDGLTKERDELKTKLDTATSPETLSARVKDRVALEQSAQKVLGSEVHLDGKSDRDIKIEVLMSHDDKFDGKDRSDDYINGRFDTVVSAAPERSDSRDANRQAIADLHNPPQQRADGKGGNGEIRIDSADTAKRVMIQRAAALSRKDLRVSSK